MNIRRVVCQPSYDVMINSNNKTKNIIEIEANACIVLGIIRNFIYGHRRNYKHNCNLDFQYSACHFILYTCV